MKYPTRIYYTNNDKALMWDRYTYVRLPVTQWSCL